MTDDNVLPTPVRKVKVKPTKLPAIILNDDDKITVIEWSWDGKDDHFMMYIEGMTGTPMVHLRSYKFEMTKTKSVVTYVLCDDRISPAQLAEIVTRMTPWFYSYGIRVEN